MVGVFFVKNKHQSSSSEVVKIALRDVGNKLLLAQNDSISLILPVKEIAPKTFELSFDNSLEIYPNRIVETVEESFKKVQLPDNYRVEVNECESVEVAYSYMISPNNNQTLVPCRGRILPENCYKIQVFFLNEVEVGYNYIIISLLMMLSFLIIFILYKIAILKRQSSVLEPNNIDIDDIKQSIGQFYFYPKQHKLVKAANEISLSKKECEILSIFINRPNQVIKRDELTKEVWEDHGVFVGRSLDTYISKLRKKLQTDSTIKITNVHGVGYKLEIDN